MTYICVLVSLPVNAADLQSEPKGQTLEKGPSDSALPVYKSETNRKSVDQETPASCRK